MNKRSIIATFLSALMILTVFSFLAPVGSPHGIGNLSPHSPVKTFNGDITIEPNGTITSAGNVSSPSVVLTRTGDYYNLTGNINGTLAVEHNGTIFNGMGHNISYTSSTRNVLVNMSDTHNVSLQNTNLNGNHSYFGILLYNTSDVAISGITEYSTYISVYAGNYTSNISIWNSRFIQSGGYYNNLPASIILGEYSDPSTSTHSHVSPTSSNITLNHDNFSVGLTQYDVLVGSSNSSVLNSNFSDGLSGYSLMAMGNHTTVYDNNFSLVSVYGAVNVSSGTNAPLNNITIDGNNFNLTDLNSPYSIVNLAGTGSVSNNNLSVMNYGQSGSVITLTGGNTSVLGNSISVQVNYTGNSDYTSNGIVTTGNNYSINRNSIQFSGPNKYESETALTMNSGSTGNSINDISIAGNSIDVNASKLYGISSMLTTESTLTNSTVWGNKVQLTGNFVFAVTSAFKNSSIGNNTFALSDIDHYSGLSLTTQGQNTNNISITGNSFTVSGPNISSSSNPINQGSAVITVSNQIAQFSNNNVSITHNDINVEQNNPSDLGIYIYPITSTSHNIQISENTVRMKASAAYVLGYHSSSPVVFAKKMKASAAYAPAYGTSGVIVNLTISGNHFIGTQGQSNYGIYMSGVYKAAVYNNTVANADNSFYIGDTSNATVAGNYIDNTGNVGITLANSNSNLTVYHNDFMNYTTPVAFSGTGSVSNISFNESLPVGGNYWSGYKGTDANGDGIGDTPYLVHTGYYDHLPLMGPWVRPVVTFNESGLVNGTPWSVTFNGQTKTSTQQSISFTIVNGTYQSYSYSISGINGYNTSSKSGVFHYSGNAFTQKVSYKPSYSLTFSETGLPSGTAWSVYINGTLHTTKAGTLSQVVTNGTKVSYKITNTALYYASVTYGNATIVNSNRTISFTYTHWAYLNLSILPGNSTAILNGVVQKGLSGNPVNETIKAGTYRLEIKDSGYVTYYKNFTVSANQTESLNVDLKQPSTSPGTSGLPKQDYYYIAGGVAAVVVIAALVVYFRRK